MTAIVIYKRMMDSVPEQYDTSRIFREIQLTVAEELARIDATNEDIRRQLFIRTATWGLKHWEEAVGLQVNESYSFEVRRSRILGRLRSIGNFSVAMVKSIAAAYTEAQLDVSINFYSGEVIIEFVGVVPADVKGFQKQVSDVIHAHLGVVYRVVIRGEKVHLDSRARDYKVPLPITGTIVTTKDEHGKLVTTDLAVDSGARDYKVRYPITGVAYTGGKL